jgi:hypothetical protein
MTDYEAYQKTLHNAIFWQNHCVHLYEIIEMFCVDAETLGQLSTKQPEKQND